MPTCWLVRIVFADDPDQHSDAVAQLAERQRLQLLLQRASLCLETLNLDRSKIDALACAKRLGNRIIVVLIHRQASDLSRGRSALCIGTTRLWW